MSFVPRVAFVVGGQPLPKGRPRSKPGQQAYTPPATRAAEKKVREAFQAMYPGFEPLSGALMVMLTFYRKTRQRVDLDNLVKLPTDALNGVAFVDDALIEEIHAKRIYGAGDEARTIVRIFEKQELPVQEAGDTKGKK